MARAKHPVCLLILDGFGINQKREGNAICSADTPHLDELWESYPHARLAASGEAVGLMEGQMGDSNVGHLNIGAGRIVYQDVARISKAVREQSFHDNEWLVKAMTTCRDKGTALHLMGLLSPGGVHSHSSHLYALLDMAAGLGLKQVYIHTFLDGRDVPPASAHEYMVELENKLKQVGVGRVATVSGRYYAMDRDKRWDRTEKAYNALVMGEGRQARSSMEAVQVAYGGGETDEFVVPTVIVDASGRPTGMIEDDDSVIFFNFRADRARQITRAFTDAEFTGFPRTSHPRVTFVGMTRYDETIIAPYAFPPQDLKNTLGEVVAEAGWRQLRIAETEKYAHVTFFFSGGDEETFPGEERKLIPSPKVATYDLKPEMSAPQVAAEAVKAMESDAYDLIVLNFANCDMVGHTGILPAAIQAVETIDACVHQVVSAMLARGGYVVLTADHGNAEQMIDYETGEPHTAHTLNPVPVVLITDRQDVVLRDGILADLAPTVLELLELRQPREMSGTSLIGTRGDLKTATKGSVARKP
ncbi:MAG: 2,3-bisphosphoglycerate-independent phosphoglycerate mutase [Firmicutes bacterium]|nr:2,3-bisphosphoglycerate-independent phosphoglycerate mutase [Bacillota bacterium]